MMGIRKFSAVLLLILMFAGLTGCDNAGAETDVVKTTPEVSSSSGPKPDVEPAVAFNWSEVSGRHTQGMISSNSPIRIEFNRDVILKEQIGADALKVISLSPKVAGTATFISTKELVFVPENPLKSGAKYTVDIAAVGLIDIPVGAVPYRFGFNVVPMEFEVRTNALLASAETGRKMKLTGELLTSDRVMPDDVKRMLTASFQNKPLAINWVFDDSGKRNAFTIHDINRETFASDVMLSWDGAAIGIEQKGKQDIAVPVLNQFELIDVAVMHDQGTNPYVQINFSDPLDASINFQGLVQIADEPKDAYKVAAEGNLIKVFPKDNLAGSYSILINPGIRSEDGQSIPQQIKREVEFDLLKPQLKFVGGGSILPENSRLQIPFEAVAINAVEVSAFEIYADNVGQFLQINSMDEDSETGRVGRYLWRKTLPLNAANYDQWNRYSIDVTDLMKNYNGSLIRLELSIKRKHSTYACVGADKINPNDQPMLNNEDYGETQASGWDGISNWQLDYSEFRWHDRNNPCKDYYYVENEGTVTASNNFIASNIGLIAKQDGHGNLHIISTDIRDAKPLTGVELEIRNYQGQVLATAKTDGNGFANVKTDKTPFLLVAKKFSDTAYLKLNAKTALTVSHFDIGGKKLKKGLKGSIYGERGVWRPGDQMHLTFALYDKDQTLPANHPVTMQLIDPRGRVAASKTSTTAVGDLYPFIFKTDEKDPTGTWIARASLGGSRFNKNLSVETVRPNRLKVELDFDAETLYKSDGIPEGTLSSQWLHGATAEDLKADIAVRFSSKATKFTRFSDYEFDDPARDFSSGENAVLEGRLDKNGKLRFMKDFAPKGQSPGMLRARFTSRVFENSGAFSISQQTVDYHPYENYVGIKLPKGDATRNMLLTDTKHIVKLGSLTARGEPVGIKKVKVSLYKIDWKWWWDKSSESLAQYADSESAALLKHGIVSTNSDGDGSWDFEIKYPSWGRYLVRACDMNGEHCSGKTVYVDWPGWAGRAQEEGSGAASRLNLFSDKTAYTVGETAVVQLPKATEGRALLTVETGSEILSQQWVEFDDERTQVELPITAQMAPNAYVHVTLLQPHKGKSNERPLRLYGIVPLEVADPATYLKPIIEAAEEWAPETTQKITVSESNGKAMNYTLAVVDEGLLGLTNFKTPNLHREFYVKEALGVNTWDLFDSVIGAYNGKLERMLAIGGGQSERNPDENRKRRFPPVVKVMGPFKLEAGETKQHEVTLPPYIGAVRAMLVAADQGAFGKTEQEIFVRQPLIMQASMPRVLGTEETFDVPVTLFVTDEGIKQVTLDVETDDLFEVVGASSKSIGFSKIGEKLGFLTLKTRKQVGKARLKFIASSGEHRSESEIFIDIRRPNKETTRVTTKSIDPGKTWVHDFKPYGLKGTNHASLELSAVPPLNLDRHLNYLLRYPHGCLEQTTSAAFPQLYLNRLMQLSDKRKQQIQSHIGAAVEGMRKFQNAQGEFNYWPGAGTHNAWASIYAGHFLIEAKNAGYLVPPTMLSSWLTYQASAAQRWEQDADSNDSHTQAYRLYVLSLAKKPQMGAMNRLRESSNLNTKARWMLASAYYAVGQSDAASNVIDGLQPVVDASQKRDNTFSSHLGDLGIQLANLVALDKKESASLLLEQIGNKLGEDEFQSTQGIAWALMAASRYLGDDKQFFTADYTMNSLDPTAIESDKPLLSTSLVATQNAALGIKNTSGLRLYASVISRGVPELGDEKSLSKGLNLTTFYEDNKKDSELDWGSLPNGSKIAQGTDIKMTVTVKNDSPVNAEYLALTVPVAAGWEILNDLEQPKSGAVYDHKDQRDDRIHYYFDLKKGDEKTFSLVANAAYLGQFYVPAVNVEAMYDGNLQARERGKWVHIVKPEALKKEKPLVTKIIKAKRSKLYDGKSEAQVTKMFVIAGDKVTVLKEEKAADGELWYFIRFNGRKVIEKWIKADTVE